MAEGALSLNRRVVEERELSTSPMPMRKTEMWTQYVRKDGRQR